MALRMRLNVCAGFTNLQNLVYCILMFEFFREERQVNIDGTICD